MSNYKFKLQKLLDIRINEEEKSIINFKTAQSAKKVVEDKLDDLNDKYEKYKCLDFKSSIVEQKIRFQYASALSVFISEAEEELEKKKVVLEDKREELKKKQVERKTVEVLKSKKEAEFIKEQNLKEQRVNDELALYAFMRNIKVYWKEVKENEPRCYEFS